MANLFPNFPAAMERPLLASDRVRYVGEPVAVVVAESKAVAEDAAALVVVEYEPFDAVVDLDDAAADNVLLFPEHGTNVVMRMSSPASADFTDSAVVVALDLPIPRMSGAPMEAHAGIAWWEGRRLVHHSSCQGAHPTRDVLARLYGLDPADVRVVVPDVGGGFGVKSRTYSDEATLGALARLVGRPVRWVETRREHMVANPQGHGQQQHIRIGRTAQRPDHRLPARRPPGRRRVPADRCAAAGDDDAHAHRRLRHRQRRLRRAVRRDQQGADHGVPRRRSPGGHGGDRAGGRCVRRRDRHGSRRRPPAQPHPPLPRPVHHRDRDHLRRRRLPCVVRGRPRRRRLLRAARRASTTACRWATGTCSASGWVRMWRSPPAVRAASTPRSLSATTAGSASSPGRRRRARATTRHGRWSSPIRRVSRSPMSTSSTVTPTSCPAAA